MFCGNEFFATDGFDTLIDLPKPGNPPSNYISTYFEHNDYSAYLGNYYTKDIKKLVSLNSGYKVWIFKVNTDQNNKDVTLVFSEFADVPNNYEIKLKDLTSNITQDIRTNQNYTYNSGTKGVRTFELTIGVAPIPNITVDPTSLNFNQILVGSTSNKDIKITNTGNTVLTVTNVVSSNSKYTFSGGTNYTIAAGDEKTVTVTFSPIAVGIENGNLTITSDDPDSPTSVVTLTGTGFQTNPNLVVTPSSLAFGSVTVNSSSNLSLKIKNEGDANLTITNIVSGNGVFTFTGGTTHTILPNNSVMVTVTFLPTAVTAYNTNLTITSNDPVNGTLNVALSGTGTALQPNITVNPTSLSFGDVAVGNTKSLNIAITNDGQADLNISNIIITGSGFNYLGTTNFNIVPAANSQISILFKPTSVTTFNGTVKIVSNSPGEDTITVTLTGAGTSSSLSNKFEAGWSLMSIPLTPANPLANSVIGSVIYPFYLYGYNNAGGYIDKDTLYIGSGYWLGIEDTATIKVTGLGNTTTTDKALNKGWNLVSSPFIKNISKTIVKFTKGNETVSADEAVTRGWIQNSYYQYNSVSSSYLLSDSLKQWKGYWFASLTDNLTMKFEFPNLTESAKPNIPDTEPSLNDWKVNIFAKIENSEDNILSFGANVNATDGFDTKYDLAKPPISPSNNSVYSYFPNTGSTIITKLANDIKKAFTTPDEGKTWLFDVITSKIGTIELNWNDIINQLPNVIKENYRFKLTGFGITNSINMLTTKNYQFNAESNVPYSFVINSIITGIDDENGLSYDFKLMQNFPNPFNPSTVITFTIPNATFVTLKVYDMLGKEVATLVNTEVQSGYHHVNFNATGLSSGVYFYTINAGSFTDTKKLILAK
ncbi:MAG TPA: choice-of-anchor D domain-containing protein [Melioribacteraceae bacterium]|nr:choice-of-anchor D domain-containing protein [Melioribacteraceae bacterium]